MKLRGISADTWAKKGRLSRIIVLLFNILMTKHNLSTFIGKKAGKTTIFLCDTKLRTVPCKSKLTVST